MPNGNETDPYPALYEAYRNELRALYDELVAQRQVVLERYMQANGVDEEAALEWFRASEGPLVHHGRSIHLIRKYWLEVARLKEERFPQDLEFEEPLAFLVENLADDDEDDLVEFLTEIAYWPIGLDEDNKWS